MNEDKNLRHKFGNENHFTVPEDYSKNLVPNIMDQLPEQEVEDIPPIRLWDRVKPWVYMAAMFCGLLFTIRAVVSHGTALNGEEMANEEQFSELPDEYIDPMIDQMMIDDYTLYVYLTDADAGIYK